MGWGKRKSRTSTPAARASQVAKLKNARAANEAARGLYGSPANVRKTAAVWQRIVDNSSDAELIASELD